MRDGQGSIQFASAPPLQQRRWEEILKKMFKICAALVFAGLAISAPSPNPEAAPEAKADPGYESHHGGYAHSSGPKCHHNVEKKCHKRPEQKHHQECHEEYDIIVDTTYIENCEEIVQTHCEEQHTQVHHSSQVVGHDSHKIHGGYSHGYHKRDAEAGHQGYSSGPHCKNHVDHKCHKVPQQHERKVPRKECKTIVDTTYIEECEEEFVTECQKYHQEVHHSSQVVGHDTHVVDHHSHGYGHH